MVEETNFTRNTSVDEENIKLFQNNKQVFNIFKNKSRINLLDIGVGSGCILLSILKNYCLII